jgi:murein DD-endopeptidase MepM/ murein hydrolase activator NlpD
MMQWKEASVPARNWTIVLLPEGPSEVRQFRLSRDVIRMTLALTLFAVAALAGLLLTLAGGSSPVHADARLLAKNEVLERELEYMAERMRMLEGSLAGLADRDTKYRLLAGLEPMDADVMLAGIGGPDDTALESSELYAVDRQTATLAFDVTTELDALIRRASVLSSSWSEAERALSRNHARLAATPSIQPTQGFLTSSFSASRRHPLFHRARPHNGIDIAAPTGTPVVATANGRVQMAARRGDYGLLIEIDHGFGVVTRYAHLSRMAVKEGQRVERGQQIGAVGTSGLSAGPHLHYEVLVNGRNTNPTRFILDMDVIRD